MSTTATKSTPVRTQPRGAKGKVKASKAKSKRTSATSKTASAKVPNKTGSKRLRPGGLDDLVVDYMKKSPTELPATAGTVGRGIKRSSGAVANCLVRLEKARVVRVTSSKPRRYDLVTTPK
jgi:hypothetical protein